MRKVKAKAALLLLGGMIVLGVLILPWAIGPGSSEAQQDGMHNCPQAGKWAISVWGGPDGTETGEALATCGAVPVVAAYYLDPQTQVWSYWFGGQSGMATLTTVDNMQGVLALGAMGGPPPSPSPTPTATPTPTPTPTATPKPEPVGLTRENPVPLGHALTVPPGWEIKVLSVDWDAWPEVQAENMFNDPPQSGYRMIMVRVSAKNVQSGGDTDLVWDVDFAFVGSQNVVRKPFDPSCGVIPDDIWAELFPGGRTEGNVCFQAPTTETGLLMIAEFSWSDQDRRYFALQ